MSPAIRRDQAGITVIGFLFLATLFGVVALAAIKLTPMYIMNMKLSTALNDIQRELSGQATNPAAIRTELQKRFSIEDINLENDKIKVTPNKTGGFTVQIEYENRAPYAGNIYLVLAFDKQVEIRK
jgi:uncharacterized protein DUF4845